MIGNELRQKLLKGIDLLADAVGSSLGPHGRTTIIKEKNKKAFCTKDGVSIARAVKSNDYFEGVGIEIIKQAAESTVASAGDGTTTSIVLARAMLQKAHSIMSEHDSVVEIKKGMDEAVKTVLDEIEKHVMQISSLEQIEQIATISANGDKAIGKMIALAVDKIGKDGSITVQEGRSSDTMLDVTEGFTFDSGLIANAFITDERRGVMRYEDCLVLVTDMNISTIDEMLPALELAGRDTRPLVIVAEQVEGQALAALIHNKLAGNMKVCAIKAPLYGEDRRNLLQDLATITGATFLSREIGSNLRKMKMTDFGQAKIVEASKYNTTIVSTGTCSNQVLERAALLKGLMKEIDDLRECERIQSRITRLSSGVAVIKVGAATEVEMIEKKHRIEDALEAVQSAQQEGVVIGGGLSLLKAAKKLQVIMDFTDHLSSRDKGYEIIYQSIEHPYRKLTSNASCSTWGIEDIFNNSNDERWNIGIDFSTGEECNMIDRGIIDPFKVIRCALQNAASAAGTLLTTEVAIVEV